jgi:putative oxidoreductase
MKLSIFSPAYEAWVPVIVRCVFGFVFLMSAYYKIPGTETFTMQVGMSEAVGIPLPLIAVLLAFILEVVGGIALIVGWHVRIFAFLFAGFVLLIALFFYRDWSDQATFGMFMSAFTQSAALVYISVYGAQHLALKKDPLPHGLYRG